MKKIKLAFYYLILFYLPMQPFPGYKIFYRIKFLCLRKIFNFCGENVIIKSRCYFGNGSKLSIGNNSQLGQNARLVGPIKLGNNVMMGPDVIIMGVSHDISRLDIPMNDLSLEGIENQVCIGNNVWIGTRAILMPGISIGDNSIVGAGAVVTKSFPSNSVLAGVPAKLIKNRK
jgi:maltose O-acetyltransferase